MAEDTLRITFRPKPPDPDLCPICQCKRAEGAERALAEATAYLEKRGWPHARYEQPKEAGQ